MLKLMLGLSRIRAAMPALLLLSACGAGGGGGGAVSGPSGATAWLIPSSEVVDGGPGRDGIPSIQDPAFLLASTHTELDSLDRVVGVRHGENIRAYPHEILDYHEIVNDVVAGNPFSVSYCPLTGSAMAWQGEASASNPTFGVSGLLYNSNLILFDRATLTSWSQMLELAVNGTRSGEQPERLQVVETTWETWQAMYPDSIVMTRLTGHERTYGLYPYGTYRVDNALLFPVSNIDVRLHPKARVIGIRSENGSRVYQLDGFGPTTQVINDQFEEQSIVVAGNSARDFAVIFGRERPDGTILNFTPLDDQLPNILQDDEGNVWDIFGVAVAGPRVGEQLTMTRSFTAMWFAWAAFFPDAEIHFN